MLFAPKFILSRYGTNPSPIKDEEIHHSASARYAIALSSAADMEDKAQALVAVINSDPSGAEMAYFDNYREVTGPTVIARGEALPNTSVTDAFIQRLVAEGKTPKTYAADRYLPRPQLGGHMYRETFIISSLTH